MSKFNNIAHYNWLCSCVIRQNVFKFKNKCGEVCSITGSAHSEQNGTLCNTIWIKSNIHTLTQVKNQVSVKELWCLLATTDTRTLAVKRVHNRIGDHECPSLRLRRGECTSWKIMIQQNINKLISDLFQDVRRLLNIDKYNVVNDYCQNKFTNIQAEIIRIRKNPLIQIWLTNGPK